LERLQIIIFKFSIILKINYRNITQLMKQVGNSMSGKELISSL